MANELLESSLPILERCTRHFELNKMQVTGSLLCCLILVFVRWTVGLNSYSGEHTPPMFGDYEAQRHWMELTLHLPMSKWYFNSTDNDLQYWGLDYPPLTAYVSYVFGLGADIVEPSMVEFTASRGYESPTSKMYMRASVIACGLIILFPAVYAMSKCLFGSHRKQFNRRLAFFVLVLLQPSFILIDHGHFQYNNVCLGLTAAAISLLLNEYDFLGSVFFCLALNFKQMSLYFAPAFGCYLLSRCIHRSGWKSIFHFFKLAVAVVSTFTVLWAPFCVYTPEGETCVSALAQVVHRIFPFARGLFEDKVANFWCVLDLFIKVRQRISSDQQMRLCTLTTFIGFLPSVVDLLRRRPSKVRFLLALTNASLSFFLFSFQVHEKTILLPLLPISLLQPYATLVSGWLSLLSTFSMFFLLMKDGQVLPYLVLQCLYFVIGVYPYFNSPSPAKRAKKHTQPPAYNTDGTPHSLLKAYVAISLAGVVCIHLIHLLVEPPSKYPHIHDYLFAAYSCGHLVLALVYFSYWQWTCASDRNTKTKKE